MFGTFRKHSQPLWIAIIIVVVISFVVFFTPDFDPFDTSGTITVEAAAVEQARNQILLNEVIQLRQRQSLVKGLMKARRIQEALQVVGGNEQEAFQQVMQLMRSPDVLATTSASRMAGNSRHIDLNGDNYNDINSLEYRARIRLRQLTLAQEQLGIIISDSAVRAARNSMVQNFNGAQEYNVDQYDQLLKQLSKGRFIKKDRIGQEQFEDYLRSQLTLLQLNEIMTRSAGFWPDADMAETLAQQNRKYAVEAAFISLTNHTASATNYADITKADGFTNHFNLDADLNKISQVPARRTIAYVKLALADFEGDIRKELKFDDEVQKLIELHNTSTNKLTKLTDINGTALPLNATNLLARSEEKVREGDLGKKIFIAANTAARAKALAFRKALFSQRPFATANLEAAAKQFSLQIRTATFSREAPPEDLPTALIDAAFTPSLKTGKLLEPAVHSPDSIYILGLQEIIPLREREYSELNEDEKQAVHKSFLESENHRLARDAGYQFRAAAVASLKEGATFTHAATNAGLRVVTLPPFSLSTNANTNHIDLLKDLVPLSTLQTELKTHEQNQLNKDDPDKENLTAYLENASSGFSSNDTIAGYVLHITERITPPTPDATELHAFADRGRQYTRNQGGGDWFSNHQRKLDSEIINSSLKSRLAGLPSEINEIKKNILYKEKILTGQFATSLKQAGITDKNIISPLEKWSETQTGTLKKFVNVNYFAAPPQQPEAAQIIVPLLSAGLLDSWDDLDEMMTELEKLKKLRDDNLAIPNRTPWWKFW